MDILEGHLETGHDKVDSGSEDHIELSHDGSDDVMGGTQTLTLDAGGQYRLTTSQAGGVTYRVVQVGADSDGQAQVLAANAQVLGNAFGSAESLDALTESPKLTYIPTVDSGGGDSMISQQVGVGDVQGASLGQVSTAAGSQFYVMMSPQDVLQAAGQRVIVPRTGGVVGQRAETGRSSRDDRRRTSHNEVERRRRDKINNWIVQLSKLLPDTTIDHSKAGQVGSKGGILSKACEYIQELRAANGSMGETLKETERLSVDNELLRQQVEELKQENMMLRQQLQQHGIVLPDLSGATV